MKQTKFWAWHMLAGLGILILGGMHMVVMHLAGIVGYMNPHAPSAIDWQNVVYRAQHVSLSVIYILLLLLTLFHGFYGLRNILLETRWGGKNKKLISGLLVFLGVVLFAYGSWVAIVAVNLS